MSGGRLVVCDTATTRFWEMAALPHSLEELSLLAVSSWRQRRSSYPQYPPTLYTPLHASTSAAPWPTHPIHPVNPTHVMRDVVGWAIFWS